MKKISYPHPIFAKEGWIFIGICIVLTFVAITMHSVLLTIVFLLITVFVMQFFRDPQRATTAKHNELVAPADGRVVVIEECTDPYRQVPSKKVSIFMNVFNVHSQRIPIDGEIVNIIYNAGKFLNASLDKSSTENERNAVIMKLTDGREITVVQVAGLIARRILCYIATKDRVALGQRYGFIRFGSRVDLYLPLDAKIKVNLGDKVSATSTIIASL